ncbi:hypothetical protein NHX12_014122 [Muraenolepis orangiensis]|uniref:Ig-like domain-containing protein n=1 Tax=Muraenolepis orangiensis TaxID=630683 RepID=A0A9Q0I5B3_9TELE|nr:hypothetical protein NHX12_014122 [Muraenolepis orangiensis]
MTHICLCLVLYLQRRSPPSKYSHVIGTELTVSPAWYLHVGDRVSINCTVRASTRAKGYKVHLKIIWTPIGPGDITPKVVVEEQNSTGVFYQLGPATHEHQGFYTCLTVPQPDTFAIDWHQIIWVADTSPVGSLDIVSHDRSQFFNNEMVTLTCQVPGDHSQWKMMRFDDWIGEVQQCPGSSWSSETGLSCTVKIAHPWSDMMYWCESATGLRSNPVNFTATAHPDGQPKKTDDVIETADA